MNDALVFEADTSASVTQFVLFLRRSQESFGLFHVALFHSGTAVGTGVKCRRSENLALLKGDSQTAEGMILKHGL